MPATERGTVAGGVSPKLDAQLPLRHSPTPSLLAPLRRVLITFVNSAKSMSPFPFVSASLIIAASCLLVRVRPMLAVIDVISEVLTAPEPSTSAMSKTERSFAWSSSSLMLDFDRARS
jgi:hypothetical protein